MPTRREFLKLSAIAALGAAAGCAKPDGNPTARPTEAEPTKAIPPTKKIDVTDTPNVPATKEAERLNAILAEGYPTSFTELSQEKMLSEADFLKQLEKFPNIGKEYKQVKAMLSAGLSKEKVNLSDIAFEVSSFSWDSDKYSWIVIARNSKTGEVYVPRDAKTHTRNIDMSVYGYLKEYQAGGALPFTMEPLKLPEFSGPEYKVGFSRSKKGWLVAFLDGGPQKGWYDFRDRQIARWKTSEDKSLILKGGVNIESGNYTQDQEVSLSNLKESIRDAISGKKLLKPSADFDSGTNGLCLTYGGTDFLVGLRECKTKEGKASMVPMAMDAATGAYMIPSDDGYFVMSYPRERGVLLEFDDPSDLPKDVGGVVSIFDFGKRGVRVSYPSEDKKFFVYRKQGLITSSYQYSHLLISKYVAARPVGVERISWPDIPSKEVIVDDVRFNSWIDALFDKFEDGTYKNIAIKNTGYKVDEGSLRETLNMLRSLPDDLLKYLLRYPIKLELTSAVGVIGQRMRGSSLIQVSVSELQRLTNVRSKKIFSSLVLHEQIHASQDSDVSAQVDFEFMTYYFQILALNLFGMQNDSYTTKIKADLMAGTYPRRLV